MIPAPGQPSEAEGPRDPVPAAQSGPAGLPAPFNRRLLALGVDGILVFAGGGLAALFITLCGWSVVFHADDFDGPAQLNALGDWLIFGTWAALALAYTAPEAFGLPTVGKFVVGLRLPRPAGSTRAAARRRWVLSYLPLLVILLVCVTGAAHTWAIGWEAFEEIGWQPDPSLGRWAGAAGAAGLIGFAFTAGPGRRTLAERLSGYAVESGGAAVPRGRRGFDVLPLDAPVPRR